MTYTLTSKDFDKAQNTLACAFFNYPFPARSIAEPRRQECLEILFRLQMEYILERGSIEAESAECGGVVVWSTVGAAGGGASAFTIIRKLLGKMKISEMIHLARNAGAVEKGRKSLNLPPDTVYLFIIGVRPDMQGKGIAAKLIAEKLAECEGRTIYLETNTEHNCRYYQRLGFELIKKTYYQKNDLTTWYLIKNP